MKGSQGIGLVPCLAFAVGTMVGGGVFTLSGTALNEAGPAALVSYLVAGTVMLLSALSFVAISSRAGPGESGYGPVGDLLSPLWRYVVMWGFYLNGLTIIAFLLVSFGEYLRHYFLPNLGVTVAALLAGVLITWLNLGPADLVARTETLVVALKIALLLVFVAWGVASFTSIRFTPFAPHGTGGVLSASALLFTAYTGFNVVTNMASSVRNPRRTVPIAVMGSVLFSAALYIGVVLAMLASDIRTFGAAGVGQAAEALMGAWGGYMIAFAACLSTLSGANANMLGASEIMLRMVARGDVPPIAGRATRRGHPLISVLFIGAVTVVLILTSDITTIVGLANVGALVSMVVVNMAAGVLALRGWPGEGTQLPGGVAIPVIGTLSCLAQFPSLGWRPVALGLLMVAAGLLVFRLMHRLPQEERDAERARAALHHLETPLLRALRGPSD
ncbi:APC family permease [Streptosporangium sp. NPDC051022]|uniref:APC family permease n=1 Tax=Streptosporangium sp. NPDC051022 TaxID=3155752 RepID=UPI003431BF6F